MAPLRLGLDALALGKGLVGTARDLDDRTAVRAADRALFLHGGQVAPDGDLRNAHLACQCLDRDGTVEAQLTLYGQAPGRRVAQSFNHGCLSSMFELIIHREIFSQKRKSS